MKKIVLIFVVLTLVVAAAILFYNRSERAPVGAELLPESTLLLLEVPDFQTARQQLAGSPLAAFWQEPAVQAFLQKPLAALRDATGGDNDRSQLALNLPQGEMFVAITRFAATPKVDLTGVLGIDVKTRKIEAFAYLKYYEHQLAKYNPAAKQEQKKYLGTTYTTVTANPASRICYGFLGSMLVATTDEEQMRDMIARFAGNPPDEAALARSPRYQNALSRLPAKSAGRAFVNVEQLASQFGMVLLMAAQASPALQSIGNIQATTAAVHFDPAGVTDSTLVTYAKPTPPDAPIQRRTLAAVPGDSALYAVQTSDLAGNFTKLMEALAKSGNPTAAQLGGNLDKILADAGVRLGDDFLAHLGPEVAYVGNWRDGARAPDFALVVEVKDRAALAGKFATIVKAVGQSVAATDVLAHADETLHVIRTGSSYAAPTYVLTAKYFVLALTPDYAKEIVTQIKAGKTSLADAADFQRTATRVPSGGSSFTYCDLRKVLGGLYTLAHLNATNTDASALLSWTQLPPAATLTRHLGPYVSTTVAGEKASTTTSYSPLGKPMTLLITLAGGIAAAQPYLGQIPLDFMQGLPTMSSGTGAPRPPPDNQTATSQTPASR